MSEQSALPYRPCVGIMLLNTDGKVWVGQRIDGIADAWQMPQGGIDTGEDPQDAALRELCEETGITHDLVTIIAQSDTWLTYDLPEEMIGKVWKGKYRGQKQKWFLLRYLGDNSSINIKTKHPEFSKWEWRDSGLLLQSVVPFKRDVYRKILEIFDAEIKK